MGAQRPVRRMEHKTQKMRTTIKLSPCWSSRNYSQGYIIGTVWAVPILLQALQWLSPPEHCPIFFIHFSRFTTKIISCDYAWTARRSNQSILKEINPGYSLEGMMLKLKLQYFGHLVRRVDSLEKTLMLGGIGGRRDNGMTEDEMAGWHHRLNGRGFEWTPGDGDGQGGLACCNSWVTELDPTEWLNWTKLMVG